MKKNKSDATLLIGEDNHLAIGAMTTDDFVNAMHLLDAMEYLLRNWDVMEPLVERLLQDSRRRDGISL